MRSGSKRFVAALGLVTLLAALLPLAAAPPANAAPPEGFITGTVTDGVVGIEGVLVQAYTTEGILVSSDDTGPGGVYTIGSLYDDDPYNMLFVPPFPETYAVEWYDDAARWSGATAVFADDPAEDAGETELDPGASISGRVTDANTTDGIPDAWVDLYDPDINVWLGCRAVTDPDGNYDYPNAKAGGEYKIMFGHDDYYALWYRDKPDYGSADLVDAGDSDIDQALNPAASFTGVVTDGTDPVENTLVQAYDGEGNRSGEDQADGTGAYEIRDLDRNTEYKVLFIPPNGSDLASEWHDNVARSGLATPVTPQDGLDAVLGPDDKTTGRVKDSITDAGIEDARVDIFDPDMEVWMGWTDTDGSGDYELGYGWTGNDYKLQFTHPDYQGKWHLDRDGWGGADEVQAGQALAVQRLVPLSSISIWGNVTDDVLEGLEDISVKAYDLDGQYVTSVSTDENGDYMLTGLEPGGEYKVLFIDDATGDYAAEWYDGAGTFMHGQEVNTGEVGIDAELEGGHVIAGTVTDQYTGHPLEDCWVGLYDSSMDVWLNGTWTGVNGTYMVRGLRDDTGYKLLFLPAADYFPEWYDDKPDWGRADPVQGNSENVDAALLHFPTASVSGTVTGPDEVTPLEGISVYAVNTATLWTDGAATTGPDGSYEIDALTPGAHYKVLFTDDANGQYAAEWYDNKVGWLTADGVTAPDTGIDASLQAGEQISGTVLERGTTDAVVGCQVDVYDTGNDSRVIASAVTGGDGEYAVSGLHPGGAYKVRFGHPGFAIQWYSDAINHAGAWEVYPPDSSVDGRLDPEARASGTVTDGGDNPLANVDVFAYDSVTGMPVKSVTTGVSGDYELTGLAPGATYRLLFIDTSGLHDVGQEWYDDAVYYEDAQDVVVSQGSNPGYDAVLDRPGAVLSVHVKDADSDEPIEGCLVMVFDSTNNTPISLPFFTNVNGDLSLPPFLCDGEDYRIAFAHPAYFEIWYGDGEDWEHASNLTVPASITQTMTLEYPPPAITGIDPADGPVGTSVTIEGTGFGDTQGDSYVSFGAAEASIGAWSADTIEAVVPGGISGAVPVTVTTPGGTSNSESFEVTGVEAPVIDSLDPTEGPAGTTVTITGRHFGANRGVSTVNFGGTQALVYPEWTDEEIEVEVPPGAYGVPDVSVTTGGGTSNTEPFSVTPDITPPLMPDKAAVNGAVTINGTGFGPTAVSGSYVSFDAIQASSHISWANECVSVKVPAGASGVMDVTVTTAGGTSTAEPLSILPTLNAVTPSTRRIGENVTLNGTAFGGVRGASTVTFGGVAVAAYNGWSDTVISVVVPGGLTQGEKVPVRVTTGGGTSNSREFTVAYDPPVIDELNPDTGEVGDEIAVLGDFPGAQAASVVKVRFGDTESPGVDVVNETEITAEVPAGIPADPYVTVDIDGRRSNAVRFSVIYPPPDVTGVSPVSGNLGATVNPFQIDGSDFRGPAGNITAELRTAGQSPIPVTVDTVTATRITGRFTIPPGAAVGLRDMYVRHNDDNKNDTLEGAFTVQHPPPNVSGLSPAGTVAGSGAFTLTVNGTGFVAGSKVRWNGKDRATTYASPTRLTAAIPASDVASAGTAQVTVFNPAPGGGTSNARTFTVTSPVPPQAAWYLAEGTSDWGFDTYVTIQNPNDSAATAKVTYMTEAGPRTRPDVPLPPMSQTVINPRNDLGSADFSTKVECREGKTIAVDRRMIWTGPGAASPEGHSSVGVTAPADTWYLPEGSSSWGFETWLCIQNPGGTEATCSVTYMVEDVGPRTVEKKVPAGSRRSFNMADDLGDVAIKDASIKVDSNVPVIAERAMYRNNRRSGHCSIGTTTPAPAYYLAEGTTDWGFTTYLCVQNPQDTETTVNVSYLTKSGPVPHRGNPIAMPPNSRKTIRVNDFLPKADFSTTVTGTRPIIAERAMYWDAGRGEACHDSIGMDSPHTTFYLPDGETYGDTETWTCVQNPNDVPVTVEITYMTPTGTGNVTFPDAVAANSRKTYDMRERMPQGRAAITVTSKTAGRKIMVERAMYWNARGAGTNTIGGYSD